MALLFTLLLGLSAAMLGYVVYAQDASREWLAAWIIVCMSMVVGVSFLISYFVVSRINTIASTARDIMETGDLSRRISISTQWDDLSNLAQLLNAFLAQTESLMHGIREVSNNIAHDLRTPLTRLRNQIEEHKTRTPSPQDMEALLAEADHLLAIFHSLLRINNIEQGKRHQSFAEIKLNELLEDVIDLYEPVAEEKNIRIIVYKDDSATISGDKHLLFQLFANLLDNAIKFSPISAQVMIAIDRTKVMIADSGPGIHDEEKEQVFDRFYRGDASRHTPGNGLGLSLVKAIADLHKAHITLHNNIPGLKVSIAFQPYQ